MFRLAALLLLALSLGAQDPLFRIRVTMQGRGPDSTSFTSNLEIAYAPCEAWVGGSGGWVGSPAAYLEQVKGLGGVRPGMSVPFYAHTHSGSASGGDGSSATVTTTGPGTALWTERDRHGTSVKQTDPSLRPSFHQSARFYRTASGARIADFDLGYVSAGHGTRIGCADPYGVGGDGAAVAAFPSFEITNEELANFKQIHKTKTATFSGENGSVTVTITLTAEIEDVGEVTLTAEKYDSWIPEGNTQEAARPGNSLTFTAKVHPVGQPDKASDRRAKLTFTLAEVSREPGVCLNWPKAAESSQDTQEDLKFRAADNPELQVQSPTKAVTSEAVNQVKVTVSSYDFAAFGRLRVEAVDDKGRRLKVRFRDRENPAIDLPKAELGGRIADAWRIAEGVQGLPVDWDEAAIPGQKAKGDGMSLLHKYRGLRVGRGGGVHTRLKAREKVHFVIDPAGVFDPERWRRATGGIQAYLMDEANTDARRVDFNASTRTNGGRGKCAVRIDIYSGLEEKDPPPDEHGRKSPPTTNLLQYAYTWGDSPATTERIRIFADRIRAMIARIQQATLKVLQDPQTDEERSLAAYLLTLGSREDLVRRAKTANHEALTQAMLALTALHEMAHACGVQGHLNAGGQEDDGLGDPPCPMHYLDQKERRRFLLFGEITGGGPFCTRDGCFGQLNVKG